MKISIEPAIVVGFGPLDQHMPNGEGFNFPSLRSCFTLPLQGVRAKPHPRAIARFATASPISTNADVTSGPPTRIRVGVFILFHS
ncbi:hypothetical protein ACVWZ4_002677 [Bradyrhizobium sp. USDA 4472]